MKKSPAFQFYPDEWLSSPTISMMTPAEEGAYIRLLSFAWSDPDCTIPDDDEQLALLSRLGEGWLKGSSTTLRRVFIPHPKKPGKLFNERLTRERKKQADWRKKCSDGGRSSVKARKQKKLDDEGYLPDSSKGVPSNAEGKGNSLSLSLSSSLEREREGTRPPVNLDPFDLSESYPPDTDLAPLLSDVGRTVAEICNFHPDLITPAEFGLLKLTVERLEKARGFTPTILDRFRDYWGSTGNKARIRPHYITEHFGNYLVWLDNNAKANGYHN